VVFSLVLFYLVRSAFTLVVKELSDGDGVLMVKCEVYEQRKEKVQRAQNSKLQD
jgi:acyl dehydratase